MEQLPSFRSSLFRVMKVHLRVGGRAEWREGGREEGPSYAIPEYNPIHSAPARKGIQRGMRPFVPSPFSISFSPLSLPMHFTSSTTTRTSTATRPSASGPTHDAT